MTNLYPLIFHGKYKYKIWGGRKLFSHLGKDFSPQRRCGESWEVSGLPLDDSVVKNGPLAGTALSDLLRVYQEILIGKSLYTRFGNHFPLLVKFIDAEDDLSIQVHPDDALAGAKHDSPGKTEMWYVIQADPGATLIAGFSQPVDAAQCRERFATGRVHDILTRQAVAAGDVFFLPAGRVHAIGKGILIAEIQQASDVTYRIHDYDRVDADGSRRLLDTDDAIAALDFGFHQDCRIRYKKILNAPARLVHCEHFTANVLACSETVMRNYPFDSFVIHVCVHGSYTIDYGQGCLDVRLGDCVLVPAAIQSVVLETISGFKILECYVA
ncbi:type I phosphomannose isomerase catalytic subunit [Massilia rhizosphaerae]|uniref:type I phosphomannose isomerase catalytic subunit n=1 Tax=Massilia rhizosphaerae TaxID=2784389 RepID=UPI001E426247|nr:type I phosphomannose isomerase catalytic subunit [Massilia rhizosphaerae]